MKTREVTKENLISWIMLSGVFIYMLALNSMMPLHRDDYGYALIWGTLEKITIWPDVFQSLYSHYLTHGGRMVAFFVLDSFLLVGKQWFNPFNAFLFVALIVLIYWHAQRKITTRFNPYILLLIITFCWLGLPHFAEVIIWMCGASVYLLTAVLIFAFLLPYHFSYLEKPLFRNGPMAVFGMFCGGLAAGWTIENTAATMNLILVILIVDNYRKHSLTSWMVSGFLGSVLGFLLLVLAPGNYVRYASTNTKFIYHFTNELAGSGEMLLYVFPVILFLVMVWRILLIEHAREKGISAMSQEHDNSGFSASSMLIIGIILFMLMSYLKGSFFSQWLGNLIYDTAAVRLGVATIKLKTQLLNTMSGLEEMVVYLLTIIQIFRYIFKKLALRKKDIKNIVPKVHWIEVMNAYPACYYVAALIGLAVINNLFMIASPSFPGRATFGSVVFLIIGAVGVFTIPEVCAYLLDHSRKKYLAIFSGLILIPMATATFYQHSVLFRENNQRMAYIEEMVNQGEKYLEVEPLSLNNRVLRHVYFVELNNIVSKSHLCDYYGLQDIKVKGLQ